MKFQLVSVTVAFDLSVPKMVLSVSHALGAVPPNVMFI